MIDTYRFKFTSLSGYLMHRNNIEGRDEVEFWQKKSDEGKGTKKADDRFPAWTWITYLYQFDGVIAVPNENLMSCLLFGASKTQIPGKGVATFSELSQSGLLILEEAVPLLVNGKPVKMSDIVRLRNLSFSEQKKGVEKLGFTLDVRPCSVNRKSHTRARPLFRQWGLEGTVQVLEPSLISFRDLVAIFDAAASRGGLGDMRPGPNLPGAQSKKRPGPMGRAKVSLKKLTA